jgi:hypothetical protein
MISYAILNSPTFDSIYFLGKLITESFEKPMAAPAAAPSAPRGVNDPNSVISGTSDPENTGIKLQILIPVITASCILIVVVAMFTNMRQKQLGVNTSSTGAPSTRDILATNT